ncbi:MarR family winged helix-turn-helix transcriptional regulator [Nocardioides sp.]|uniref:MarR family winged helix-turn-helix transcriptional regulator n=1 Tax=Nocardioides sp. TaxID=35761 RepID=UPI0035678CB9
MSRPDRHERLESISDSVARIIRISSSRAAFATQSDIAGVSLSQPAYALMRVMIDRGPVSMGELARMTHMDLGMTTRQVGSLVEAALATRSQDPEDKRVALVSATPEGRRVAGALQELRRRHLHSALSQWSSASIEDFDRLLQRFIDDTVATSFEDL